MNNSELKTRTKNFALRIIKLADALPKTQAGYVIGKQIIRSGTSVAANYRAAIRSRSNAEFISKINIVIEEADETLFWLELIMDADLINKTKLLKLHQEADEIVSIFCATQKTMKNKKSAIRNQLSDLGQVK